MSSLLSSITPTVPPILELSNLSCERDERQLFSNLNLQIRPGDIVQIEGPNGCGKTTLLRILTTISSDFSGDIHWRGQPLATAKLDFLNHLLYIGHLPGIKKALSPRENLRWFSGMNDGHQQCPLDAALDEVGLYGFEDVPCYSLSAGQLRRVALARLFLTPAQVWILDEPFTAIDKQGIKNLEALMTEHAAGGGSIILTTHQDMVINGVRRINLQDYSSSAAAVGDADAAFGTAFGGAYGTGYDTDPCYDKSADSDQAQPRAPQ